MVGVEKRTHFAFFDIWFVHSCSKSTWCYLAISFWFNFQNPGYMKEKFKLVIETLHAPDLGLQENVSTGNAHVSFWFLFFYVSPIIPGYGVGGLCF